MDKLKALKEQRNALLDKLDKILGAAETETRALSEDEQREYDTTFAEINGLTRTIEAIEKRQELDETEIGNPAGSEETREEKETREFASFIRGAISTMSSAETRADTNFTKEVNGAIIPSTIANKIVTRVEELCPIYRLATHYHVRGTLHIPYYDESTQEITMDYAEEFVELESTAGEFKTISLSGFLAGALTKVSNSLINNNDFDLVNFVVERMALAVKRWVEKQLLFGKTGKIDGLSKISEDMTVTAKSSVAIVADELIDVQECVPDDFQENCIWIMGKKTRKAIRKLKDNDGNYLLNKDFTSKWKYDLLGKDVYVSAALDKAPEGAPILFYGDFSGLAVNEIESIVIQVLREKYATQHATGVVGWMELDAKIENAQKIACLKKPA